MADDSATPTDTVNSTLGAPLANGADTGPAIGMISQYVKDLSFENPNSPACYQWTSAPQIDVQFNIGSQVVADGVHETVIKIDISSRHDEGQGFVVDLSYAGLFGIRNVPDDQIQAFMLAEAPRILFPFARRIIADAVRDGGFAPLLLEPIDFHGLFLAQQQERQAAQGGDDIVDTSSFSTN
jgi:preprotein translocase subunit SecB